jgi:hypothetical protein
MTISPSTALTPAPFPAPAPVITEACTIGARTGMAPESRGIHDDFVYHSRAPRVYCIVIDSGTAQEKASSSNINWALRYRRSASTAAAPALPVIPQPHRTLSGEIRALDWKACVAPEAVGDAKRAVEQAADFIARERVNDRAAVILSDDGVVTLRWERGERGVLLIFAGDTRGTYAVRGNGQSYGTNYREFELKNPLPSEARGAIRDITRG